MRTTNTKTLGEGNGGLRFPHSIGEIQNRCCLTPVYCESVVSSLRSRRPMQAEVWFSHGKNTITFWTRGRRVPNHEHLKYRASRYAMSSCGYNSHPLIPNVLRNDITMEHSIYIYKAFENFKVLIETLKPFPSSDVMKSENI